ncbi:uncharacterized protein LOC134931921 isoform X1 [Pseudophryne corroboree]|uniref:uncharacterized protein LOC134931921 isoform X1 n=1 Tax=Pseudophryne corroboree TaxID=495146 RepID=UPI0030812268
MCTLLSIPIEHDLVPIDLTYLRHLSKREVKKGYVSFRFSDGERTAGTLFPLSTIYLVKKVVSQTLTVLDQMVGKLVVSINQTVEELAQVRKVALQNRMALDQLLAAEGGTCAVVEQGCCTYIEDHRAEISAHLSKVGELQKEMRRLGASEGWDPLGWLGGSIAKLFSGVLQCIVFAALIVGIIYLTIKCGPVVCVQCGKGFKRLKVHHKITIVVVDDKVPLEQVTQGTSQGQQKRPVVYANMSKSYKSLQLQEAEPIYQALEEDQAGRKSTQLVNFTYELDNRVKINQDEYVKHKIQASFT